MKVVRIIARLNVGGPARHVVWLTKRLQNEEFQTTLIAGSVPEGEEDMSYFAKANGVEPVYIEQMSRELSPKDLLSLWKIYRTISAAKPDVIHTHTAKAGTLGRIAGFAYKWLTPTTLIGRPRQVKLIHTFHGHVFHSYYSPRKTSIFKGIEKALAALATDRIITISDQQLREIHGEVGIGDARQFRVIPLGLELPDSSAASDGLRKEIDAGPNDLVVAFVGRLTEIKDVPLLLKSFAAAAEYSPLKLAVIGDGSLRHELETLASTLETIHNLKFLGNRDDVAELVSGADIVALSSLNEGTPLSLIEAMAAGRPVISTVVGGVIDLLGSEEERLSGFSVHERGIGVTSRDPADYARGLIYLAENEKLRERLGNAGREFVHANYSIDRLERDITALYRELVPARH